MKIEITKDEYRALLEVFSMAEWVMHAHKYEEDETKKPYDEVIQKFYSYAKEMGMDNLIVYSPDLKRYFPTAEFEDNSEGEMFIEEFENDSFWDELMDRLAERDLFEEIGSEEEFYKMDAMKRMSLQETAREKYMDEFHKNGIKNIWVKFNRKMNINA